VSARKRDQKRVQERDQSPDQAPTAEPQPEEDGAGEEDSAEDLARDPIVLQPEVELDDDDDSDGSDDESDADSPPETALPVVHAAGDGPASALTRYMAQLRHHAPISREEEHALAVRWVEQGDVEAARMLVLSNLRLVVKIAMDYRRAWANTLDLIQEGNVGLMEAVQRYDPYLGVKLSTYAVYWIRAYILKYILDNMRSVRMGTTRAERKLFFRLNKERRRLEREGYEAEPRLLAERLDVSEDDVVHMQARLSRPDTSMDAPVFRDEKGGATFGDNVANPGSSAEQDVASAEIQRIFRDKVEEFAQDLSPRDGRILWERLLADEPLTLAELGEEFGVTRERVRQLEARILRDMRTFLKDQLVDFEFYAPSSDE